MSSIKRRSRKVPKFPMQKRGVMRRTVAIGLLSGVILAACGGDEGGRAGNSEEEVTSVTIALPGAVSVAGYGWAAAEALGYWEEENLDVELVETGGSVESSQLLAAGSVDIAEASADTLLQFMAQDIDVYPFYNFWEREFRRWVVPEESDIQDVSELAGKTVGVTALSGGEVPLVRAVLASEGILDQVELVAVSNRGPAVLSAFEQDRIQSYAGETSTLIAMAAKGSETRSILPEGLERGPIVPTAASAEFADQTDVLVGIARGVAKGSLFCLTSVEACVDAIAEDRPELVEDRDLAIETVEDGYFPITAPEQEDGKYVFGATNTLEAWTLFVDVYTQGPDPLVEDSEGYDLERLVLDHLVDDINNFDYAAVVEEAQNWTSE